MKSVVPYIGTWIETSSKPLIVHKPPVVPYIGTWIETVSNPHLLALFQVVPYIGTWIETRLCRLSRERGKSRTLYRYVD